MRHLLSISAVVTVLLAGQPAAARDCVEMLQALNQQIAMNQSFRMALGSGIYRELRGLRDTARQLARSGEEELCKEVVNSAEAILEARRRLLLTKEGQARFGRDFDAWNERQIAQLKAARPVAQLDEPMRAEQIIGSNLRNPRNEELGEIVDLLLSPDIMAASHVFVATGGLFDMDDEVVAVPWELLRVTATREVFVLDTPKEGLTGAPAFEREDWTKVADPQWRARNRAYFEEHAP